MVSVSTETVFMNTTVSEAEASAVGAATTASETGGAGAIGFSSVSDIVLGFWALYLKEMLFNSVIWAFSMAEGKGDSMLEVAAKTAVVAGVSLGIITGFSAWMNAIGGWKYLAPRPQSS
jgi:hypothetical protein